MASAAAGNSGDAPRKTRGPKFDPTQSSLVFINCCFAMSLAGPILLVTNAFGPATSPGSTQPSGIALLSGAILATYLTFTVWRQYTLYYIPLQFYRRAPETTSEELATLLVTLALFSLSPLFILSPRNVAYGLLSIVALNIWKLVQMGHAMNDIPGTLTFARAEIQAFRRKLWTYAVLILVLLGGLKAFEDIVHDGTPFAVGCAVVPVALHIAAGAVYAQLVSATHSHDARHYLTEIEDAWTVESGAQQ